VSELPHGWERTELGGLVDVVSDSVSPVDANGMPYVGLDAIAPGTTRIDQVGSVEGLRSSVKRFAAGDVLYSRLRPYLNKVWIAEFDGVASGEFLVLRGPLIDEGFLLHLLAQPRFVRFASSVSEGTHRPRVRWAQMAKYELLLPPLAEQRRIVAAIEEQFSRLEAAETILRQTQQRLDALVRVTIADATTGAWSVVRLGEVTESQIYGSGSKAESDANGVPMLAMGNIQDGHLVFDNLKYLDESHPDVAKYTLRRGDLLFNRTNSPELVGKTAVFKGGVERAIFASYLIRVRFGPDCDPDWASLVINGPVGRAWAASVRTQQVGQANVNGTKLANFPLPLPPLDEQRRLVAWVEQQLSVIDAMRAAVEAAQRRSAALRRSILELAFTGKLVPQDPNDEPASVLLARIRAERAAEPSPRRRTVRSGR